MTFHICFAGVEGKKRKSVGLAADHRDLLKKLCRGDVVTINENGLTGEACVHVVDPFKRTVTVDLDNHEKREVPVGLIMIEKGSA